MGNDPLSDNPSLNAIGEEAARWVVRLRAPDFSEIERHAFQFWVQVDPRHEAEFLAHNAVSIMTRQVLRENPEIVTSNVSTMARSAARPIRSRVWMSGLAAAAALAAFTVIGWVFMQHTVVDGQTYVTGVGQTRTVTFDDGSQIQLNTATRLQWLGNAEDRRINLLEGEAYFAVAPDPKRPFRVLTDQGEIRVLGTRFNVYRKADRRVVVSVVEGSVEVRERDVRSSKEPLWLRKLVADQQVTFGAQGLLSEVKSVKAGDVVRWREGVLKIDNEPLAEVVEELKRYTNQKIVIRDPRLVSIGIGGAFSIHDTRAALDLIAAAAPLKVQETEQAFILDYRQ